MDFSPNVQRLQPSATIAVSSLCRRLISEGRDVVDLSAGEPDFDTPDWIASAGAEAIRNGHTRYTPAPGAPELRRAIAGSLSRVAGREIEWERIVVGAGAKQPLFNACFCLFGPEDEVLIASPYWTSYPEIVSLARATPVPVAGPEERDFLLGPEALEEAATERTRGLVLSSPCNPTGAVYDAGALEAVAAWAAERGIWVIADEIYREIYFGDDRERAPSFLETSPDLQERLVLIDGASKAFAMTGWRIGFAYAPAELASRMSALQSHTTSNAATPSQRAALKAYGQPERSHAAAREMAAAFRRRRDLVIRLMGELLPDVRYVEPRGAFYLFFRVDGLFPDSTNGSSSFCTWALEETGVALVPGVAFGDDRYVRMSFATSDELLETGLRRLAAAVEERRAG